VPKCHNCKQPYTRTRGGIETWCSPDCGLALARKKQKQKWDRDTRRMKKELREKKVSYWIQKAQTAFNAYIRARDRGLPCVSCGCPDGKGKRNAGHYRPAGVNGALRFHEANVHGQCERCNTSYSGNLTEYRKTLISRVGIIVVEWLDSNHEVKRWTIPELQEVERYYKAKIKEIT
jgi:hypothetical protein